MPANVEVDVIDIGTGGAAEQTFTDLGRSIHFANQTRYEIRMTNLRSSWIAVDIWADGEKANLTPVLVARSRPDLPRYRRNKRRIPGFARTRDYESDEEGTQIEKLYEPFVAQRSENTTGPIDSRIGTLRFDFFEVKHVPRGLGPRRRRFEASANAPNMNQAREGVLATRRAPEEAFWEFGHHVHADTPRKPIGNTARPLEVARSDIIICERRERTVGEFI